MEEKKWKVGKQDERIRIIAERGKENMTTFAIGLEIETPGESEK